MATVSPRSTCPTTASGTGTTGPLTVNVGGNQTPGSPLGQLTATGNYVQNGTLTLQITATYQTKGEPGELQLPPLADFDLVSRSQSEQVSLFLGPDFVITFQEEAGWDCLEPVRERIRKHVARVREAGPGHLAYGILDAVIDHYFPVLEEYGERLEALEDRIVAVPGRSVVTEIHDIKRELLYVRRAIWSLPANCVTVYAPGRLVSTKRTAWLLSKR